jgi:hypothetical protein
VTVISGNAEDGVYCEGAGMLMVNTYVGTDSKGALKVPNGGNGVWTSSKVGADASLLRLFVAIAFGPDGCFFSPALV